MQCVDSEAGHAIKIFGINGPNVVKKSFVRCCDSTEHRGKAAQASEGPCNSSGIDQFCIQSPSDDARAHQIVVGVRMRIFDGYRIFPMSK